MTALILFRQIQIGDSHGLKISWSDSPRDKILEDRAGGTTSGGAARGRSPMQLVSSELIFPSGFLP